MKSKLLIFDINPENKIKLLFLKFGILKLNTFPFSLCHQTEIKYNIIKKSE